MICVGDIHGDLNQLIYPLIHFITNKQVYKKILYIGDYTSQGFNDIYLYELIRKLLVHDDIIFLAGNHDVQKYYSPNLNAEMSSFFDFKFNSIGLKTYFVWNDTQEPIVFTHCRCNIPIGSLDTITYDEIRLDRLYDRKKPPQPYFNIYGHEHHYGGDEHKLCVDYDSSFIYDSLKKGNSIENSYSNVSFSLIKDKNDIQHITKRIKFGTQDDFNSKSFSTIADYLNDLIGINHDFNLNESFEVFKEEYSKSFKKDPKFQHVFQNLKKIWSNIGTWGTYGNVPFEFFEKLGIINSPYKNIVELKNMIQNDF